MTTHGSPYVVVRDYERDCADRGGGAAEFAEAGPSSRPMMTAEGGQNDGPQISSVSRTNKALAAISGAVATSLTMTPFDVIKTRMQTQPDLGPLFQPSSSTASSMSQGNLSCCRSTFVNEQGVQCRYDPRTEQHVGTSTSTVGRGPHVSATAAKHHAGAKLNNGVSSAARPRITPFASYPVAGNNISAAACIYPDKNLAVHELEKIRSEGRLSGLWDGVVKVGRHEGVRGLWRGLTPTLAMTVPSQVTYMTCYDVLRTAFLAMGEPPATSQKPSLGNVSSHTMIASLAAGSLARAASATLVTPLELLRTRLQASDSSNLTTIIKNLTREIKGEGPAVLWRGLVPTLYRDVPFSGIYFAGYESLKRILTGSGLGERHVADSTNTPADQHRRDFAVAFISGASSGILAAIVTQPFDLIKTRLQANEERNAGRLQGAAPASHKMGKALRDIVQHEGYRGLFRGMSPRVAKVAPACGIMIASFELVAGWLDKRSAGQDSAETQ